MADATDTASPPPFLEEADIEGKIRIEQSVHLVGQTPAMVGGTAFGAVLCWLLFLNDVPAWQSACWAVVPLLTLPAAVSALRLRGRSRPQQVSLQRIRRATISSTILGLTWSALVILFVLQRHGSSDISVASLLLGCIVICTAAVAAISALPYATAGFCIPLLLTVLWGALYVDMRPFGIVALFAACMIPALMLMARGNWHTFRRNVLTAAERRVFAQAQAVELSRRLEAEGNLRGAAEAVSRAKSQFLANMSHELRTPLNAVIGDSELMMQGAHGALPTEAHEAATRVHANGRYLLAQVEDMLDLAAVERGDLAMAREPYTWDAIVADTAAAAKPAAEARGLELRVEVQPGLPPGIGDPAHLSQALRHLVGNAIKFTDEGIVQILASANASRYSISVLDTGPGLSQADQLAIFRPFRQLDDSHSRRAGGAGIGLAVAKAVVERHGGTLTVRSQPGAGATFTIDLPVVAGPSRV